MKIPVSVKNFTQDRYFLASVLSAAVFFAVFFGLSVFRYNTLQYHDWDFSIYANSMWNIIHGKAFITIYDKPFLGNHFTPIAFLLAPIYFIARTPLTLIFIKILSLSLITIPVYLIARRRFPRRTSFFFSLMYLLYPSLLFVTLYEFHFEDIAPLLLALSFFFMLSGRRFMFLLFSALAMLCKENIPLITAFIGLYAAAARPGMRKTGIAVFAISAAYFFAITLYLQPMFTPGSDIGYAHHYSQYGKGFLNIFGFLMLHPFTVLKNLFSTSLKMRFFGDMLSPVLYLPLLSPDIFLITAPVFMKDLLSKIPTAQTVYWHYTGAMVPFMIFSVIFSVKRLSAFNMIRKYTDLIIIAVLIIEVSFSFKLYTSNPQSKYFVGVRTRLAPNDLIKEKALSLVPRKASCIATFDFLPRLSQRSGIYTFYMMWKQGKKYTSRPDTDYALIDFNDYFIEKDFHFVPDRISKVLLPYISGTGWTVKYTLNDIVLLEKKPARNNVKLVEMIDRPATTEKEPLLTVDDSLELTGFNTERPEGTENIVHITFYWHVKELCSLYRLYFAVSNSTGRKIVAIHSIGYRYFLPSLSPGKILKENYWILLPAKRNANEKYELTVGFADILNLRKVHINASSRAYMKDNGRLILGKF